MKISPKSCSCRSCRRGKSTRRGKFLMQKAERAVRHLRKSKLAKLRGLSYNLCWFDEVATLVAVPIGKYYD